MGGEGLLGSIPVRREEKTIRQRWELNCNAVAAKALVNPTRRAGAGTPPPSGSELGQVCQVFTEQHGPGIGGGLPLGVWLKAVSSQHSGKLGDEDLCGEGGAGVGGMWPVRSIRGSFHYKAHRNKRV